MRFHLKFSCNQINLLMFGLWVNEYPNYFDFMNYFCYKYNIDKHKNKIYL